MRKIISFLFVLLFLTLNAYSVEHDTIKRGVLNPPKYPDSPVIKENSVNRKPVPYAALREADVMWSKRVWRVIDLREKMNLPLYYPDSPTLGRKSLFDVIIDEALHTGDITCFGNPAIDDEFRYEMTRTEVLNRLSSVDTQLIERVDGSGFDKVAIPNDITSAQVWKYWVKEDWFYDKQRSVMEVRIIGLCPLIEKVTQSGDHLGADVPLFWIYFPEARPVFANSEVFMRKNDAERRTLDDVFWKRMFSSYIRKESNVHDRGIYEYKTGLDCLLESDRVKNDIFTFEHDLWHF
ncbi:MAG TPA: gliding motility protein GldN [Bacteroidia bacterium]|jgi:gliding motility associated protien GldN